MSEKEAKKEEVKATVTPINKKSKGSDWSIDKCKKFARRFSTNEEWQKGHQASHKAAESHGWLKECQKCFGENQNNLKTSKKAA